jgi:hypothetical protein
MPHILIGRSLAPCMSDLWLVMIYEQNFAYFKSVFQKYKTNVDVPPHIPN